MSTIIAGAGPQLVTTLIGDVPESDLEIHIEKRDEGTSWTMTRVCVYKGSMYPTACGQVVRQDVWVAMKSGIQSGIQSGL